MGESIKKATLNGHHDIVTAAALAFGLLAAAASNAADRLSNTLDAKQVLAQALADESDRRNGRLTAGTVDEKPNDATQATKTTGTSGWKPARKSLFVNLDGTPGGQRGCESIDIAKVEAALSAMVEERADVRAGDTRKESGASIVRDRNIFRQAAILIRQAY